MSEETIPVTLDIPTVQVELATVLNQNEDLDNALFLCESIWDKINELPNK